MKRTRVESDKGPSTGSKRKRSDDEDEDLSRKHSRSDSCSTGSGSTFQTSQDTGPINSNREGRCGIMPKIESWLAESTAVGYEHTELPPLSHERGISQKKKEAPQTEQAASPKAFKPRRSIPKPTKVSKSLPAGSKYPSSSGPTLPIQPPPPTSPEVNISLDGLVSVQYSKLQWHNAAKAATTKRGSTKSSKQESRKYTVIPQISRLTGSGLGLPRFSTATELSDIATMKKAQHSKESSPTRTLINAFQAIGVHCEAIGASSIVADTAKAFFQEIVSTREHEELSIHALAAACVVCACKWNRFPHNKRHVFSYIDATAEQLETALNEVSRFLTRQPDQLMTQPRREKPKVEPARKNFDYGRPTGPGATWRQDQIGKYKHSGDESFRMGGAQLPLKHFSGILST